MFISLVLVSLVILALKSKLNKSYVVVIYGLLLLISTLLFMYLHKDIINSSYPIRVGLYDILWTCLAVPLIIIFYVCEKMLSNVIFNKVLVLDIKYYFGGRLDTLQFVISIPIALLEECAFRLPLIIYNNQGYKNILFIIIVTSFLFGINHLFFSKYNAVSKYVLGVILAIISIYGELIITAIVLHIIYNFFVSRHYES